MLCLTIMTSKAIEIILISPAGIYCGTMKKSKNIKMIYDRVAMNKKYMIDVYKNADL